MPVAIDPAARRRALHLLLDRALDGKPGLERAVDRFLRAAAGDLAPAQVEAGFDLLAAGRSLFAAAEQPARGFGQAPTPARARAGKPKSAAIRGVAQGQHVWQPAWDDRGTKYLVCARCRQAIAGTEQAMRAAPKPCPGESSDEDHAA